jgi:hypothetical protein
MFKQFFMSWCVRILSALAVIAAFSVVALFLWNWLIPEIFGLPRLNYWQIVGLLVLARLVFGGAVFRPERSVGGGNNERQHNGTSLRLKWLSMSKEEREAFMKKREEREALFEKKLSSMSKEEREAFDKGGWHL